MHSFKDTEGRDWILSVNPVTIRRVRERHKFDLSSSLFDNEARRLLDDPVFLVDLVFTLIETKALERSIDLDKFASSIDGDTLEAIRKAFRSACVEFFPPSKRGLIEKVLSAESVAESEAVNRVQSAIDGGMLTNLIAGELGKLDAELSKLTSKPA